MGKRQVLRDKERMAAEFTQDLEAELQECRVALQGQAQVMLDLLLQFETRLQARLAAAESRIAAIQAERDAAFARPLILPSGSNSMPAGMNGSHRSDSAAN